MPEVPSRSRRPRRRWAGAMIASALVLGACGGTAASRPAASKVVDNATVTFALQPGDSFNWMFPYESDAAEEPWVLSTDEDLWMPLYFEGDGNKATIDPALSLADPPVYSDADRTVTIGLKARRWSDGKPVTARDVQFAIDLLEAGKDKVATYVPGELPDNLRSVQVVGDHELVLHLDRSYNPQWYTDNQLTELFAFPQQTWDRERPGGPVGNYDLTAAGAKKVFDFLYDQSEKLATYATNPLWKVVDGPFRLTSYDPTTGRAVLSANRAYDGADEPRVTEVVLEAFTDDTAEVDALRDGSIDYGWIPYSDLGLTHYLTTHGFTVAPWAPDYEQSAELGYTGRYAEFVDQLYIRQALQHLVDEQLYLKTTLRGIGQLTYGPAPAIPGDVWASRTEETDPDPYSIPAARAILGAHGWSRKPGGYLICSRPGVGAGECGKGIAAGVELRLLMNYATGSASVAGQAQAFAGAARRAGVDIVLAPETSTTMSSIDGVCPSSPPCNFAIALYPLWFTDYGDMGIVPTGGLQFGPGNYFGGGYSSTTYDRLLAAAHTEDGLGSIRAAEDYLSRQVAALWFPTGDNQISVVSDRLHGWRPQQVFGDPMPQRWYVTTGG